MLPTCCSSMATRKRSRKAWSDTAPPSPGRCLPCRSFYRWPTYAHSQRAVCESAIHETQNRSGVFLDRNCALLPGPVSLVCLDLVKDQRGVGGDSARVDPVIS